MGSLGGGGSQTIGFRYFMTLHMGLARGPLDEIVEIRVGEKQAWPVPEGTFGTPTPPAINDTMIASIYAPQLFGGDKAEGGVAGKLWVYMGKAEQVIDSTLKIMMGGHVPDFRGVVSIFYDGLIASLNPYPKPWGFRVRRTTKGWQDDAPWYPEKAAISLNGGKVKAINAAHIIYESATNKVWGRSLPSTRIDEASFIAAADRLHAEGFGLCMAWKRRDTLDAFIQSVTNHIGAVVRTSRETGLLELKLIRDDYDPEDVPLFDYNSGLLAIEEEDVASPVDAINEVIVSYFDPVLKKDKELRVQNLASIQSTGAINSAPKEYVGLPTDELAGLVAVRDLRAASAVFRRYQLKLDRRAWRINPGDVLKINVPEKGISNMILRVGKMEDRSLTEGQILVHAVIDVFGLGTTSYVSPEPGPWQPPDTVPQVVEHRYVREATYHDLARTMRLADLEFIESTTGAIAAFALRPSQLSLYYEVASRTGSGAYEERGIGHWTAGVHIPGAVSRLQTIIPFDTSNNLRFAEMGMTLQLRDEIVQVEDIDTISSTMTVKRGCIDTIPKSHASDFWAFFINPDAGSDGVEYALSEDVDVKLLTKTSSGALPVGTAPVDTVTIQARQGRPYPPVDPTINGVSAYSLTEAFGGFTLAWKMRNRVLQFDQVLGWGDANVAREPDVTYQVRVFVGGILVHTASGITANSWVESSGAWAGSDFTLELSAFREGLQSLAVQTFTFERHPADALQGMSVVGGIGKATLSITSKNDAAINEIEIFRVLKGASFNINTATPIAAIPAAPATTHPYVDGSDPTNVLLNSNMDADTNWSKGTGWTYGSGNFVKTAGVSSDLGQNVVGLAADDWYYAIEIDAFTAGLFNGRFTGGTAVEGTYMSGIGTIYGHLLANGANTAFNIGTNSAAAGSVTKATLFKREAGMPSHAEHDWYACAKSPSGRGPVFGPVSARVI